MPKEIPNLDRSKIVKPKLAMNLLKISILAVILLSSVSLKGQHIDMSMLGTSKAHIDEVMSKDFLLLETRKEADDIIVYHFAHPKEKLIHDFYFSISKNECYKIQTYSDPKLYETFVKIANSRYNRETNISWITKDKMFEILIVGDNNSVLTIYSFNRKDKTN